MDRLSGDQKTVHAPSVAGTGWRSSDERSRNQTLDPLVSVTVKASRVPSGEMAKDWRLIGGAKMAPGGWGMMNWTMGCAGAGFLRKVQIPQMPRSAAAARRSQIAGTREGRLALPCGSFS